MGCVSAFLSFHGRQNQKWSLISTGMCPPCGPREWDKIHLYSRSLPHCFRLILRACHRPSVPQCGSRECFATGWWTGSGLTRCYSSLGPGFPHTHGTTKKLDYLNWTGDSCCPTWILLAALYEDDILPFFLLFLNMKKNVREISTFERFRWYSLSNTRNASLISSSTSLSWISLWKMMRIIMDSD